MSMIGNLHRLPEERVTALLAAPEGIVNYLHGDDAGNNAAVEEEGVHLDLDKAWHGLHFLLTGTAWEGEPPLNFIVTGGEEIGDVDVGYGPARAFTSDEVRAIAQALGELTSEELATRFDGKKMNQLEIYPSHGNWVRDDDTVAWLLNAFGEAREFLAAAATSGEALIVYLD